MRYERPGGDRVEEEQRRRPEPAPAADLGDPRRLARTLGNARFGALLEGRPARPRAGAHVLARTLNDVLPLSMGSPGTTISVGAIRQFRTKIVAGWHEMMSDEIQVSFVDVNKVQDKLTAAADAFTALESAAKLIDAADPDAATLTKNDAATRQGPLGALANDVVANLVAGAKLINRGYSDWKSTQVEAEPEEVPDWQKYEKEKSDALQQAKQQQWASEGKSEAPDGDTVKTIGFPHNGKHQPPPKLMSYPDNLRDQGLKDLTSKDKAVALYKSNVPATVIAWELQAMNEGLTLSDNFTIIYAFEDTIGADGGEMTRFIRCENTHHGHPIVREGPTSFNDYMRKEVTVSTGNEARREELRAFLRKVKIPASTFNL